MILFWIFYLHPIFVFKRKRYVEMASYVLHVSIFYHIGFWVWLLTMWLGMLHLFITFGMNHTFMPVSDKPNHWIEYSLLHTANVEHVPWADWATGYLNYQIEHHLFPTIPNFRLPQIKHRVKALAEKHNLPYIIHSYPDALCKFFKNMTEVSKELSQS